MAADPANVISGPAQFKLSTVQVSHTQGGITATIKPSQHNVTVDMYGVSVVNMRHTGDDAKLKVPLAEYSAIALAEIYDPGNDQTAAGGSKYMGVGRSAGYVYTTQAAQIVPYLSADSAKICSFWRVSPIGEVSQNFEVDKDRIVEMEFICMVDTGHTDGELIGKIVLTAS